MTSEQRSAFETFRSVVAAMRLRVTADPEGFPIASGRYGHLEWHDAGQVAIYSQTMRMLAKLLRIQGVRRHQVGDREFRLLRPVDNVHDRAELEAIARLVRIRVRRRLSERQKLTLIQGRRPFRPAASEGAYAER
jgi:hypothetical protein